MERIEALLAQLTLEEKVSLMAGSGAWHSTEVPRLGIPAFKMTDGPNGARGDGRSGAPSACFPVGSALAATWNPELIEAVGGALGDETRSKGAQVLLGPTVNIHRHPLGGRHFECYSEDPLLSARIAVGFVRGVQSRGVGACVKHYICNDSEFERYSISSDVDERTLREIYLVPFEATVAEAQPWSVMSAYNCINGIAASSHRELLVDVLKEEWGFDGFVVSDWGASLETVGNANGGLDLEMPGPARTMGDKLLAAVRAGEVAEKTIDDKVRRLLRALERSGKLDAPEEIPERADDRPEHRALARRAEQEAIVLLRNEGDLLPLDASALRRVAVIGPNAEAGRIQGGGSAGVTPHYESHPLEALRAALEPSGVSVSWAPGCSIERYAPAFEPSTLRPSNGEDRPGWLLEYWNRTDLEGEPVEQRVVRRSRALWFGDFSPRVDQAKFSARYSGTFTPQDTGVHEFGLMSAGRSRMYVAGELLLDHWDEPEQGDAFFGHGTPEARGRRELIAGEPVEIRIEFARMPERRNAAIQFGVFPPQPEDRLASAVATARDADAVVLVVGTNADWETEGNDRHDFALPAPQPELIERVVEANPKTVVVLNAGSPVAMDWAERVPAIVVAWFGGQEMGRALADVLLGEVSPSGRLPTTIPRRLEDTPAFTSYPGEHGHVRYGEGVFVGYRWYDARDIEPRFPFGHGLSYTSFAWGPLRISASASAADPELRVSVELELANRGTRPGAEVVQLYVRPPAGPIARPPQELRAFCKPKLAPGESAPIRFELGMRAFACWDPTQHRWIVPAGRYEIAVGASSRDIRATASIELS